MIMNLNEKEDHNLFYLSFYSLLIIFLATIFYYGSFENFLFYFQHYGDNNEYIEQTKKIFNEDYVHPSKLGTLKSPFGLSFVIYLVSKIFFTNYIISFFLISIFTYFLIIFLTSRLLNHVSAYAVIIIGYELNLGGIYGGSQNLALCLIISSFLLIKNKYFIIGIILASLSYYVRPLCIAAPISIFFYLLFINLNFKKLFIFLLTSIPLFILYIFLSVLIYDGGLIINGYGSNFDIIIENQNNYEIPSDDKQVLQATNIFDFVNIPFSGFFRGIFYEEIIFTNFLKNSFFLFISIFALIVSIIKFSKYSSETKLYILFFIFFLFLLSIYNSVHIYFEFPRFIIPVLPFIVFILFRKLNINLPIFFILITITSVFNFASSIGVINFIKILI